MERGPKVGGGANQKADREGDRGEDRGGDRERDRDRDSMERGPEVSGGAERAKPIRPRPSRQPLVVGLRRQARQRLRAQPPADSQPAVWDLHLIHGPWAARQQPVRGGGGGQPARQSTR